MPSPLAPLALAALVALPAAAQDDDLFDPDVVRHVRLTFPQANWHQLLLQTHDTDRWLRGDLEIDGALYPDVGVRYRGGSTFLWGPGGKRPIRVQLDAFVPGQEHLGVDALRLNNGAFDPSFVREAMLANAFGSYLVTSQRAWTTVEVNGSSLGVYVLEEHKDRRFLRVNFGNGDGSRYKSEGARLRFRGWDPSAYRSEYELLSPPTPRSWFDLIGLCHALSLDPPDRTPRLRQVLDVDGMLWFFAASMAALRIDGYPFSENNTRVVADAGRQRMHLLMHDNDLSFGVAGQMDPLTPPWLWSTSLPAVRAVAEDPDLENEYFAHLRTLVEDVLDPESFEPLARRYQARIDADVAADPVRNFTVQDFRRNLEETITTGQPFSPFPGVFPIVRARRDYLLDHPRLRRPAVRFLAVELERSAAPLEQVGLVVHAYLGRPRRASSVELRWSDGSGPFRAVPMHDDGAHGDGAEGDRHWTAELRAMPLGTRLSLVLVATDRNNGAKTFHPRRAEYAPLVEVLGRGAEGLRVTEVLYDGADGEFVELTNTTDASLDLAGWSLDDADGVPGAFDLSPAGVLAPGETVVVTDANASYFRSRWGLAPSARVLGGNQDARLGRGDVVHVFAPNGAVADRLAYGDEDFEGSHRPRDASGWVPSDALGDGDAFSLAPSRVGDASGAWTSLGGDVGSPGAFARAVRAGLGHTTCASTPNDTGHPARLAAEGRLEVARDALVLEATNVPEGSPAFFLASRTADHVPGLGGGAGVLCLGAPLVRFSDWARGADRWHRVRWNVPLDDLPAGGRPAPGETWRYQLWFRDAGSAGGSNTSSDLVLTFE